MSFVSRRAAGCVVLRDQGDEPEVLMIWHPGRPDPRLPKGGVEHDESDAACAVRETREETGYRVSLIHTEPVAVRAVRRNKLPYLEMTIHFYLAQVDPVCSIAAADPAEVSECRFIPVSEALQNMKFPEEIEALKLCLEIFRTLRSGNKS